MKYGLSWTQMLSFRRSQHGSGGGHRSLVQLGQRSTRCGVSRDRGRGRARSFALGCRGCTSRRASPVGVSARAGASSPGRKRFDVRAFLPINGSINFTAGGNYSFTGLQTIGGGAPAAYSVSGTYAVNPAGMVTLTNPQKTALNVNARLGTEALVGSSTRRRAIPSICLSPFRLPQPRETNASVGAGWTATDFELTAASTAQVRTSIVSLALDGAGNTSMTLTGHAANFNNGAVVNQAFTGGTYSVNSDGSGSLALPSPPGPFGPDVILSSVPRTLYVSQSGNVILAGTGGAHDIFVAVRNATGTVAPTNGQRFWGAGIRVDSSGAADSYTGSSTVIAADSSLIDSRRLHETGSTPFNWTVASLYTLASDGTGSAGAAKIAIEQGGNFVAASVGSPLDPTGYEIAFGVNVPTVSGSGVFVNPQGVVNSASNAPAGDAISPGEFIAIYGSSLAANPQQAPSLPFPTTLGGVSVSINGVIAPIYFVSPGQVNCIVPYEVTGQNATIVVTSNGMTSNSATVSLARTSPGVFTIDGSGTSDGAITHADGNPGERGKSGHKGRNRGDVCLRSGGADYRRQRWIRRIGCRQRHYPANGLCRRNPFSQCDLSGIDRGRGPLPKSTLRFRRR